MSGLEWGSGQCGVEFVEREGQSEETEVKSPCQSSETGSLAVEEVGRK